MYNNLYPVDPYPPPNNILLTGANMTQLNFSWSPVDIYCPNISYNINITNNCGECPSSTEDTSISCTTAMGGYDTCFLTIQSEVCGHIVGYNSHPVEVIRKGNNVHAGLYIGGGGALMIILIPPPPK